MESTTSSTENINTNDDIASLIKKEGRLNWDTYFITIALLASRRSSCNRLQVGCVITKTNRILATGYNGFLTGAPHISRVVNNHEQFTVHAEQNAICDAAYRGISLSDSTAYITHYPCINCLKLLIAAGVNEIKYWNDYKNNPLNTEMLIENNIKILKIPKD